MKKVLDLFSGIGGFTVGLEATGGFKTVAFCEIDPFCQKVLKKNWSDIPIIEDIKDVTNASLSNRGIPKPDIITAGFPCQPFSVAGKQRGSRDERNLWPDLARAIGEVRPKYILLENVPHLIFIERGRIFRGILGDLAACGYDAEWQVISAASVGAWHKRDRLWIIAYINRQWELQSKGGKPNKRERLSNRNSDVPDSSGYGLDGQETITATTHNEKRDDTPLQRGRCAVVYETVAGGQTLANYREQNQNTIWATEPSVGRLVDGIPDRSLQLAALGNAVVPQVVTFLGELILKFDDIMEGMG